MRFAVRIHGRGGQGVVTSAELLATAAFHDGHHAQAFPSFGSERTGAPVVAFCRIDERPIRAHEPIGAPDAVLVQDPTLLHHVDVFGGLSAGTWVVVNSRRSIDALGLGDLRGRTDPGRLLTVPASELAREHLGRPLPGPALLAAFAAATGAVSEPALDRAIRERFPGAVGAGNARAAAAAWRIVAGEAVHG
jgi:pyruvate ferredoxin oxidoreductase gamma subunit